MDREITTDRLGFPTLMAKRLRAILRDAYEQLADAGCLAGSGAPTVEDLFGSRGQTQGGSVSIANALLEGVAPLHAWIAGAQAKHPQEAAQAVPPEEVIGLFTEIRSQTAMDRSTGAPRRETLRLTRAASAGQEFVANVDDLSCRDAHGLALAAGALLMMGTTRNRGLGEVRCRLERLDPAGKWEDLTAPACKLLAAQASQWGEAEAHTTTALRGQATQAAAPPVLRYTLELTQPAIFPELAAGDPNTQFTLTYVPGSAIHGAFAHRLGASHADFASLFCEGRVRFLNATPWVKQVRMLPMPQSVRSLKNMPHRALDLAQMGQHGQDAGTPALKRLGGAWCNRDLLTSRAAQPRVVVRTELTYHHARPAADKTIGRPVGPEDAKRQFGLEPDQAGALFVYECVAAGQAFCGEIAGAPADLAKLQQLVPDGDKISIGRSRTAQYGGRAILRWIPAATAPATGTQEGTRIRVTLESSLITINEFGYPSPAFPKAELEAALDRNILHIEHSFVRTAWHGGYLTHQKLPRQQVQALAAGSVFVVATDRPVTAAQLAAASSTSYGMRYEEGFGRLRMELALDVDAPEDPQFRIWAEGASLEPANPVPFSPAKPGTESWPLLERLAYRKLDRLFGDVAFQYVELTKPGTLRRSLVHRLLETVQMEAGLSRLADELKKLRNTAKGQLESARLQRPNQPAESILELLQSLSSDTGSQDLFYRLASEAWPWRELGAHPLLTPENMPRNPILAREAVRRMIVRYLGALSSRLLTERR